MIETRPQKLTAIGLGVLLLGSLVAAGAAVSTTSTSSHQSQDTSYLRVAHASPDASAVDVYVDNESIATDVAFGNVTEYQSLSAGTHTLTITAAGDRDAVVYNDTVALSARSATTLAAAGEVSDNATEPFDPVTFIDDAFEPGPDTSAISIAHLSPDAPTVDVTTDDGAVVLAENLSFADAADYVNVPAGDYTVSVREAAPDNNGSVLATADVDLDGGTVYSALAVGYLEPDAAPADTPFDVVLTEDASTTVNLPDEEENATATPPEAVTTTATTTTEASTPTTRVGTPLPETETPPATEIETETETETETAEETTGTPAG